MVFRKLVQLNKNKKSLQEFICYKNGIVDQKKSHYFEFSIIDSTEHSYKVELMYLGAFQVSKIDVLENEFEFSLDELDTTRIIASSAGRRVLFSVKKDKICDKGLDFFQVNARVFYTDDAGLIRKMNPDQNSGNFDEQSIILRRLRKDTRFGSMVN